MKIAVATTDDKTISRHFGRSTSFIIFLVENYEIAGKEVRDNTYTGHAKGECDDGHHDHSQPHSHVDIINALRDCESVLCYGMGWRAAEELKANGIIPYVIEQEMSPESAVKAHLSGSLKIAGKFCRCHE